VREKRDSDRKMRPL